jgi:hypothetical protein
LSANENTKDGYRRFLNMADFYALTSKELPPALHGVDGEFSIRTLSDRERIAIEDYFFRKQEKVSLSSKTTAVVVPQSQAANTSTEDFAVLIEFALGILCVSGFQPITTVAVVNPSNCSDALQRSYGEVAESPRFPKRLRKAAASTWVRYFFEARLKTKDRLHITADRFVRYLRMSDSRDSLVDLCICLESLIESSTEISFRFAMCLTKIAGLKDNEATSELLADLYDLRSKVVHGTDPTKEHKKVQPNTATLRSTARAILTAYILYLTEHTKDEWKKYLRTSLLK